MMNIDYNGNPKKSNGAKLLMSGLAALIDGKSPDEAAALMMAILITDTCAICGKPFTDQEWIDRHTPDNDPLTDVHDYCCPDCNHE